MDRARAGTLRVLPRANGIEQRKSSTVLTGRTLGYGRRRAASKPKKTIWPCYVPKLRNLWREFANYVSPLAQTGDRIRIKKQPLLTRGNSRFGRKYTESRRRSNIPTTQQYSQDEQYPQDEGIPKTNQYPHGEHHPQDEQFEKAGKYCWM